MVNSMRLKNARIRTKIFMVAGVPMLMAALIGGIALWGLSKMDSTAWWVNHTNKVLTAAGEVVTAAVNMETGMRGFAISGEDAFLDPYINGQKSFTETMEALQKTVSDNPPQVARLEEAQTVMGEWQSKVAEAQIAMRRTVGTSATMDDVVEFSAKAGGKVFFDKFRGLMDEFTGIESGLLVKRAAESAAAQSMATWAIIGGLATALIAGGGAALLIGGGISGPIGRLTAAMRKIAEGRGRGRRPQGRSRRDGPGHPGFP